MSVPEHARGALLDAAAGAPPVPLARLAPGPVAVLAPHPDDETLGCGMALAAAASAWTGRGPAALVVQVTDGAGSHPGSVSYPPERLARHRAAELHAACSLLGGDRIGTVSLGLPDASLRVEHGAQVADRCLAMWNGFVPAAIWATWDGDPHCDHQATAAAARILAEQTGAALWFYAVWGRFGERAVPSPDRLFRFVNAAAQMRKRRAATAHASQFTNLVDDSPDAFRMPPVLLDHFLDSPEIFIAGAEAA